MAIIPHLMADVIALDGEQIDLLRIEPGGGNTLQRGGGEGLPDRHIQQAEIGDVDARRLPGGDRQFAQLLRPGD